MKTFTLRIEKNPDKRVKERLLYATRIGPSDVHPDEMVCSSASAMTEAISKSKLEVFAAIVEHSPKNIRELALILKKDEGNVSRDVKGLELIGLIDIKKDSEGDSRATQPVAKYDQIIFDFSTSKKIGVKT